MKNFHFLILMILFTSCFSSKIEKNPDLYSLWEEKRGHFTLKNLEKAAIHRTPLTLREYDLDLDYAEMVYFPKENIVLYKGVYQFSVFDPNGKFLYGYDSPTLKEHEIYLSYSRYGYYLSCIEDDRKKEFLIDIRDEKMTKMYISEVELNIDEKVKRTEIEQIVIKKHKELYEKAQIVIFRNYGEALFLIDNQWFSLDYRDCTYHTESGQPIWFVSDDKYNQKLIYNKNDKVEQIPFVKSTENNLIGSIKKTSFTVTYKNHLEYAYIGELIPITYFTSTQYGYANYDVKIDNSLWKVSASNERFYFLAPLEEVLFLYGAPKGYEHIKVRFLLSKLNFKCSFVISYEN